MSTFTVPLADLQMERAVALAQEHCLQLEEMWRRNRAHGADLVGALRIDEDGSWFVGMNGRRELLRPDASSPGALPSARQAGMVCVAERLAGDRLLADRG